MTDSRPSAGHLSRPVAKQSVPLSKATRRQFLVNCSALAVTASVAPATLARPFRDREVSLDQIDLEDFARQLNTTFVVRPERGTPVKLLLVEVRLPAASQSPSPYSEDARNEKFALRFRGALASPLAQGTYWFEHQPIGNFAMFIVPIGCMDESHCYYEAIFNRPPPGSGGRNFKAGFR